MSTLILAADYMDHGIGLNPGLVLHYLSLAILSIFMLEVSPRTNTCTHLHVASYVPCLSSG